MSEIRNKIHQWLSEDRIPVTEDFLTKGLLLLKAQNGLDLTIEVPKNDPVVYFFCKLSDADTKFDSKLLKTALGINQRLNDTQGASVAYNEDTNELLMCYLWQLKDDSTKSNFIACLGNFMEVSGRTREELIKSQKSSKSASFHNSQLERNLSQRFNASMM